jgi:hypothetical protein
MYNPKQLIKEPVLTAVCEEQGDSMNQKAPQVFLRSLSV